MCEDDVWRACRPVEGEASAALVGGQEPVRDLIDGLFAVDEDTCGRAIVDVIRLALRDLEAAGQLLWNDAGAHLHVRRVADGREHLPTAIIPQRDDLAGEVVVEAEVQQLAAVDGTLDESAVATDERRVDLEAVRGALGEPVEAGSREDDLEAALDGLPQRVRIRFGEAHGAVEERAV